MKYKIEMEVDIDPTIIQTWPDHTDEAITRWYILHDVTGDTYETMTDMFDHQFGRNMPPGIKLLSIQAAVNKD